ncbi:MAG: DegV family protein, partial [Clostridium sp.]|nr:DegV family protein [Clostridium sp.]
DSGRIFFTANDLDYLRNGGRIGAAAATTGTLLKVKPLIGYENCGLVTDGIARGRKQSLQRVQELFFRYVERNDIDLNDYQVVTGFGLDREEYDKFTDEIWQGLAQRGYDIPRSRPYQIGITIGVHTGPTPIGVGLLRRAKCP